MKKLIILLYSISSMVAFAQAPDIEWAKLFVGADGSGSSTSAFQTSDGGYIVGGNPTLKLDASGQIEWQKNENENISRYIKQLPDGSYIGAYSTADFDFLMTKYDASGNVLWQQTYGGSGWDIGYSVQPDQDGGYIIGGWSDSNNDGDVTGNHGMIDYWVVKTDASGNLQWQKSYGGSASDYLWSVKTTTDGGYILAGESGSIDGDVTDGDFISNGWLVKIDSSGNIQWQKSVGEELKVENFVDVEQTTDGGYIAVGTSNAESDEYLFECLIVKLDSSGNIQWQKTYGGTGSDAAFSVDLTADGGYVVLGNVNEGGGDVTGYHGTYDYWLIKLDSAGNLQWNKALGGSSWDQPSSVQQTADGGYILTGYSESNDGEVNNNSGEPNGWVVKLYADDMAVEDFSASSIKIYPNPVKDILNFSEKLKSIQVYNLEGKMVMKRTEAQSKINVHSLPVGTYFLKAETLLGIYTNTSFIKK